jgi:hypothetical protein
VLQDTNKITSGGEVRRGVTSLKKTLATKLRRREKVVDQPRNITRGLVLMCPLLCLAKSIPEPLTSFLTHGMLWFLIILAQNESHEAKKNCEVRS